MQGFHPIVCGLTLPEVDIDVIVSACTHGKPIFEFVCYDTGHDGRAS
jgi:hypothetical protein